MSLLSPSQPTASGAPKAAKNGKPGYDDTTLPLMEKNQGQSVTAGETGDPPGLAYCGELSEETIDINNCSISMEQTVLLLLCVCLYQKP